MKNCITYLCVIAMAVFFITKGFTENSKNVKVTTVESRGKTAVGNSSKNTDSRLVMYYFYGRGCRSCEKIKDDIEIIIKKYQDVLKIEKHEIWYDDKNRKMLIDMAKRLGKKENELGTPTIIIEKDLYVGSKIDIIEAMIKTNLSKQLKK